MVTMGGNESTFEKLIKDLIYLEHDAIAAYESTIERLDDKTLSAQVETFRQDHLQHLSTLNEIAAEAGIEAPTKGDMKQILTTGKIALADLMGDAAILKAMKTNEDDTVTAYERRLTPRRRDPSVQGVLREGTCRRRTSPGMVRDDSQVSLTPLGGWPSTCPFRIRNVGREDIHLWHAQAGLPSSRKGPGWRLLYRQCRDS
jgi:hypothetical protein